MSQADLNVANQSGAAFRADLNTQLLALGTLQSGASEPGTTYAYMLWADLANGLLKQRNAANNGWVSLGSLVTTNLGMLPIAGGTMTGALGVTAGTVSAPGVFFSGDTNTGLYSPSADTLALATAGTNKLHITSAGLVGIGTSSPVSVTGFGALLTVANDAGGAIVLQDANTTPGYRNKYIASVDGEIHFGKCSDDGTNPATQVLLDHTGRLGIGTTSPGSPLTIESSAGNQVKITYPSVASYFLNATSGGDLAINKDGTERMRITSGNSNGANFLFNCTSLPSASVKGTVIAPNDANGNYLGSACATTSTYNHVIFYNSNGIVGTISTNASATAYNTSSDYRLKENVTPITNGITRFKQLKPSQFNFIADPDKTFDGFLAHEAQAVVPECVTGEKDAVDADGNPVYQGIDQAKLVPLLTAALQEAIGEIESLKARLTAAGL